MAGIFISYRRSDASGAVGRIYDHLQRMFRSEFIFKDVNSIPAGEDFEGLIRERIGQSDVVLAIIGKEWLRPHDSTNEMESKCPIDYVFLEIALALELNVPIVPVFVSEAAMPSSDALPPEVSRIVKISGIAVRADPDFSADIERLCKRVAELVGDKVLLRKGGSGGVFSYLAIVFVVVSVGVTIVLNRDHEAATPRHFHLFESLAGLPYDFPLKLESRVSSTVLYAGDSIDFRVRLKNLP